MPSNKLEKYVMGQLDRNAIKNAPYNPRKISDAARKKLRKGLEVHGMVQPVVYNKRTGNLVGGHRRLEILDTLMRTKKYRVTAAIIDVPEKQEKEINLLLNNESAMGEWDTEALEALLREGDVDLEAAGFSAFDVQVLLDSPDFSPAFQEPDATNAGA